MSNRHRAATPTDTIRARVMLDVVEAAERRHQHLVDVGLPAPDRRAMVFLALDEAIAFWHLDARGCSTIEDYQELADDIRAHVIGDIAAFQVKAEALEVARG